MSFDDLTDRSGQKVLEEFEEHLRSEEKRLKECRARLNKLSKLLIQVKAGIEHLFEKLQAIKLVRASPPHCCFLPSTGCHLRAACAHDS